MTARLLVSATRKSSGKTTITAGLCAALARRGWRVRPFKKGPDYIDPMWLSRAAGRPCINLDFHTMTDAEIRARLAGDSGPGDRGGDRGGDDRGIAVIEGNKGLFDGVDENGRDSNAALAKTLGAPVLLVADARGMTRGIAPLLLGYRAFDPSLNIAGVILNRVGGARHESKLRAAVANYTDFQVLGAVHFDAALGITERHLGLVTCDEAGRAASPAPAAQIIAALADAIAAQVDLEAVEAVADAAAKYPAKRRNSRLDAGIQTPRVGSPRVPTSGGRASGKAATTAPDLTVAIARDAAFNFYYADDLAAFAAHGARLVEFDALHDAQLPPADALVIGGGFPETHAAQLAGNRAMLAAVREFAARGRPVYAECGGLMYLARSLTWGGETWEMAGVLPARVEMRERPVGRGYVLLRETAHAPWPAVGGGGDDGDRGDGNDDSADENAGTGPAETGRDIPAHEFHYSRVHLPADARFAYQVQRGFGIDGQSDGWVHANVLANYSHLRHTAANPWVARFTAFIRSQKPGA